MQTSKIYFFLFLLVLIIASSVNAQVVVTGHVFAQIVEPVGATSKATNILKLQPKDKTENLDLGYIQLNGNPNSICNVMVSSSQLIGENGDLDPFITDNYFNIQQGKEDTKSQQIINLKGSVDPEIFYMNSIDYSGGYTVIFAYN